MTTVDVLQDLVIAGWLIGCGIFILAGIDFDFWHSHPRLKAVAGYCGAVGIICWAIFEIGFARHVDCSAPGASNAIECMPDDGDQYRRD